MFLLVSCLFAFQHLLYFLHSNEITVKASVSSRGAYWFSGLPERGGVASNAATLFSSPRVPSFSEGEGNKAAALEAGEEGADLSRERWGRGGGGQKETVPYFN